MTKKSGSSTSVPPRAPGAVPLLGHSWAIFRRRHDFFTRARAQAPVCTARLGRRTVYLINDGGLFHQILNSESRNYGRGRLFSLVRPHIGDSLVLADGRRHRTMRANCRPMFTRTAIERYAETITAAVPGILDEWPSSTKFFLGDECNALTLRLTGKIFFTSDLGESFVAMIGRILPDFIRGVFARVITPAKLLTRLPLRTNRRFEKAVSELAEHCGRLLDEGRSAPPEAEGGQDLISLLLSARDRETGEPLSDEQIQSEIIGLTLAGTVTAGSVLGWCCRLLSMNPDIQRKVQQEVDIVVGGRPCEADDLDSLVYTRAVIQEVMRLYPPVYFFTREPTVDVELGGYPIPAGSTLLLSFYALHRDPARFPDPDAFDPGRWLDPAGERVDAESFMPFSVGLHRCLGEHLAWAEMIATVATITARWQLVPVPATYRLPTPLAIMTAGRLPMILRPRVRTPEPAAGVRVSG